MMTPRIRRVLADPATRFPLARALREALNRDPVDAAHDALLLADLLDERAAVILALCPPLPADTPPRDLHPSVWTDRVLLVGGDRR